jgi:hypothetical protein
MALWTWYYSMSQHSAAVKPEKSPSGVYAAQFIRHCPVADRRFSATWRSGHVQGIKTETILPEHATFSVLILGFILW